MIQNTNPQCDDAMLDLLDEIEDAPRYYKRKCENVRIISEPTKSGKISVGDILECWLVILKVFFCFFLQIVYYVFEKKF